MKRLILSDIHANHAALDAVLAAETDWDELLFLGDAVSYGPQPEAVLQRLADCAGVFISGNHDSEIATLKKTGRPSDAETYDEWTRNALSAESHRFLQTFGGDRQQQFGERSVRIHHGDFTVEKQSWNGRLWPDTPTTVYHTIATQYDEPIICSGHSHVQFDKTVNGTRFINPGSVGQHRLGVVEACYAVEEDGVMQLRSVPYDTGPVLSALAELPLPSGLCERWRSVYVNGVLPGRMREFKQLRTAGYQ